MSPKSSNKYHCETEYISNVVTLSPKQLLFPFRCYHIEARSYGCVTGCSYGKTILWKTMIFLLMPVFWKHNTRLRGVTVPLKLFYRCPSFKKSIWFKTMIRWSVWVSGCHGDGAVLVLKSISYNATGQEL